MVYDWGSGVPSSPAGGPAADRADRAGGPAAGFITVGKTPHLNRKHTIFGEVVDPESQKVVDAIATTATDRSDRPADPS